MYQLSKLKTQSPGEYAFWTLGFLFLVAVHYFQPHPAGDGLQLSFNAFIWIPLSIAIGLGLLQISYRSQLRYSSLTLGLLTAILVMLLPSLYPNSADVLNLGRFYGLLAGMVFFVALQQLELTEARRCQLFFIVLCGVWIEAFLGWSQEYFFGPENFMGHNPDSQRPFGIFAQPNVMASFMATGLVLSGYLLPLFQKHFERKPAYAVICLLTPLLTFPLIILLSSRTGWLGALIGSALIIPYIYNRGGKRQAAAWIAMGALGIAVGFLLISSAGGALALAASKVQVDPIRMRMYPQVLRMIVEYPLTGVGLGNFEASFNSFAASLYAAGISEPNGVPNLHHPHNELMYWASEGGIVSLTGLLLAAYLVLHSILKAEKGHRLLLVGLLFPIVLHTQTEYPFYHSLVHWVIFIMLIYLVDSMSAEEKVKKLKSTLLISTTAIVIPLVTTAFMLTTLHAGSVLFRYERVPDTPATELLTIVNPIVWSNRIRWNVRKSLMFAALARGESDQVQPFIDLVRNEIESRPRWQHYQDLIFAYDFAGQIENANATFVDAQYRFPAQTFFRLEDGSFTLVSYAANEESE